MSTTLGLSRVYTKPGAREQGITVFPQDVHLHTHTPKIRSTRQPSFLRLAFGSDVPQPHESPYRGTTSLSLGGKIPASKEQDIPGFSHVESINTARLPVSESRHPPKQDVPCRRKNPPLSSPLLPSPPLTFFGTLSLGGWGMMTIDEWIMDGTSWSQDGPGPSEPSGRRYYSYYPSTSPNRWWWWYSPIKPGET